MSWVRAWLRPRGHPGGLSSGTGAIGGLILFVTALTGGIGAVQIARVHAALAQAAQAAAQSEQQSGCWTDATTQAVYQTLKGAGLNPGTVAITADTGQSTAYGGAVTAGLATKVGVSVLGTSLMTVPIAAAANASSFWTPAGAGGSNPACTTPATCPTVTTMVQHCTPGHYITVDQAVQHCTPVTQTVCGPISSEQCGYTTTEEYTCTPQQSCGTHTWWCPNANCNWINGGWECTPGYCSQYQCTTTEQCGETPVSSYQCYTTTTNQCRTETAQSCQTVNQPTQEWVPPQCTTTPETTSACG